jgi:hypothetical protein
MLYALLFLPALAAIAFVVLRPRRVRVLAEAVPAVPTLSAPADPMDALDALLAELENATLDERSAVELEALAEQLERVGEALQPSFAHGDDVEAHL